MIKYNSYWNFSGEKCDKCGKIKKITKTQSVMWNVEYDWADGDSVNTCIPCLIKKYIHSKKYLLKKNVKVSVQYLQFGRKMKVEYKTFKKLFS